MIWAIFFFSFGLVILLLFLIRKVIDDVKALKKLIHEKSDDHVRQYHTKEEKKIRYTERID